MKIIISLIALFMFSGCVNEDLITTCYAFENQTNENLVLEFWSYNSGQAVTVRDIFNQNGKGVFAKKCIANDTRLAGPVQIYQGDSIVLKFNNNKKLTYLLNFGDTDDPIFFSGNYRREEGTNNFFWDVTEEDFNNAEPY
jgi:hypothetical protein